MLGWFQLFPTPSVHFQPLGEALPWSNRRWTQHLWRWPQCWHQRRRSSLGRSYIGHVKRAPWRCQTWCSWTTPTLKTFQWIMNCYHETTRNGLHVAKVMLMCKFKKSCPRAPHSSSFCIPPPAMYLFPWTAWRDLPNATSFANDHRSLDGIPNLFDDRACFSCLIFFLLFSLFFGLLCCLLLCFIFHLRCDTHWLP